MKRLRVRHQESSIVGGRFRRIAFFSSFFLALILILVTIKGALFPIVFSFLLAYLLDPVADFFEVRRIPRSLTILVLLIVVGGLLALAILVLIPTLQREVTKLGENLPQFISALKVNAFPLMERYMRIKIPVTIEGMMDEAMKAATGLGPGAVRPVTKIIAGAFTGLIGFLTVLLALILIPVLTFFFLRDFDAITLKVASLFPRDVKPWLVARIREVDEVIGGFIRGQLTVCLIMAILYSVGLTVIGIDLSVLIGTIGGLGLIVPYVGAAIAITLLSLIHISEPTRPY